MFSKKILVLKQVAAGFSAGVKPACGICRLEKENELLTVFLSLVGFSALNGGEYRLFIVGDDKCVVKRDLGKIPSSAGIAFQSKLNLNIGISVGLWVVNGDIPLLVAYQKSDDAVLSLKDYNFAVISEIISERKLREREKEFSDFKQEKGVGKIADTEAFYSETVNKTQNFNLNYVEGEKQDCKAELVGALAPHCSPYDDEAVATENYYEKEEEINEKLTKIKELSDEYIRVKGDGGNNFRAEEKEESLKNAFAYENEKDGKRSENLPYYDKVKAELEGIFSKFPAEERLEKTFAESRFAKVYYSENKFYVVGLIREAKKEKYICYGVPSVYRDTPPKELAGYCCFVPLSVFDVKGDGYFMMFQDAVTGKCVVKR